MQDGRPTQHGALLEQLLLERAQVRTGFEAELVDQQPAHTGVRRERVGLSAPAVQRGHQRGPQTLPEGVLGHQRLELTDQLPTGAEVDTCGHHIFQEPQPDLLEAGAVGRGPVAVVDQVDQDVAAEQPQPFVGLVQGRARVAGMAGRGRLAGEIDHVDGVHATRFDNESVGVVLADDKVLVAEGTT